MTTKTTTVLTDRDRALLSVLLRTPATMQQLMAASETFDEPPFTNLAYLGRRLQKLGDAGWVHAWRYATTSPGALNYYKLTRQGYREVAGPHAATPKRRSSARFRRRCKPIRTCWPT